MAVHDYHPQITFREENQVKAVDPLSYGMQLCAKIQAARKVVRLANEAADANILAKKMTMFN